MPRKSKTTGEKNSLKKAESEAMLTYLLWKREGLDDAAFYKSIGLGAYYLRNFQRIGKRSSEWRRKVLWQLSCAQSPDGRQLPHDLKVCNCAGCGEMLLPKGQVLPGRGLDSVYEWLGKSRVRRPFCLECIEPKKAPPPRWAGLTPRQRTKIRENKL